MAFQYTFYAMREIPHMWCFSIHTYTIKYRIAFIFLVAVVIVIVIVLVICKCWSPIRSSSRNVCLSVFRLSVPFSCIFFQGLSLPLRSHDQIPTSHWSNPPTHPPLRPPCFPGVFLGFSRCFTLVILEFSRCFTLVILEFSRDLFCWNTQLCI